ncbi:MAG: DUF1648 domain-containing protein [Dehalococcoidales bacterium]
MIKRQKRETTSTLSFRWRYIALPVAILLLSLILTAYFYHLLPTEVAYHFKDGSPDKWMSRGAIIAWMLTPQFFLTLLAGAIAWGMTKLSTRFQQAAPRWAEKLLSLMGNMIALPQLILGFAMLDIFSYNAYQIHLMPWWVFALIVMGLGGIILGIFFTLAIRQVWKTGRGNTG